MNVQSVDKNRYFVNLLLKRAKKFHASASGCAQIDCHEALQMLRELRRSGQSVSFTSFLLKATGCLLDKYPYLNQHMFTSFWGTQRIVSFDDISCTIPIHRVSDQGEILIPLRIDRPEQRSILEIEELIQHHKSTPLEELPQFQTLCKLYKLPKFVLKFLSFKARSDPRFYIKHFGSYGFSAMISYKHDMHSINPGVANTAIAFIPYGLITKRNRKGQMRKHICISIICDHYVIDGKQMSEAAWALEKIISDPEVLLRNI